MLAYFLGCILALTLSVSGSGNLLPCGNAYYVPTQVLYGFYPFLTSRINDAISTTASILQSFAPSTTVRQHNHVAKIATFQVFIRT